MKKICLCILSLAITGCGSIYGGQSPVYNQNQYGNKTPQAIQELQLQQALAQQNAARQRALAEQEALLAQREAAVKRAQKMWEQKITEIERSQKQTKNNWEEQRQTALDAQNKAKNLPDEVVEKAERDAAAARAKANLELKNLHSHSINTQEYWEKAERDAQQAHLAAEREIEHTAKTLTPTRITELEHEAEKARLAAEREAKAKTPKATLPEEPTISAPQTAKKEPEKEKSVAIRPSDDSGTQSNTKETATVTTNKSNSDRTPVSELLKKAASSLSKGDLEGAAAHLESAQRLEPNNGKILFDIANVRYHQERYKDAETFASRSVRTGGSAAMQKKAWSLIANSRKALGDNQGAISAAEKAASL